MSVNERQVFANALQGQMIGRHGPTQLDDDVLAPLKSVLESELRRLFG
jgi:hypothetical protein